MLSTLDKTKADLARAIEEIRTFVNSSDHANSPQAEELASVYAQACLYANQRLERCSALLAKGCRPEAIALSEADPDLLQFVASLSFSELAVWQELTGTYGWPRAESLKTQIANAINDAYAMEKQLAPLLGQHRTLALQDAPINQRLSVLRQIAGADITTAFWRDDVAVFEGQYALELGAAGQSWLNSNHFARIQDFVGQIEQEPWTSPLPESTNTVYRTALERISYEQLFPNLAVELELAYSRKDVGRLETLRADWNRVVGRLQKAKSTLSMPPLLYQRVQPIFDQLDREAEQLRQLVFQRDVQALLTAIRQEQPAEKIDVLVAAAESHGYQIPKQVLDELAVFRRLESRSKATSTLLVVISVFAAAVFIGLFYLMFQYINSQK
ncbi:MAG TPA: hypothetical protein VMJ32_02240 [Pirellulales bacterium]|nr:hypothetical protein [Pirellulales bacterium]